MKIIINQSKPLSHLQLEAIKPWAISIENKGQYWVLQSNQMPPLSSWREQWLVDCHCLPKNWVGGDIRLVVCDMDSTFTNIECIDEMARSLGCYDEVAKITRCGMHGELDFSSSLRQRVSMIAGLKQADLQAIYDQKLKLNPGAEKLLCDLKSKNIAFALASGGFDYFANRLKEEYHFEYAHANRLEIKDGRCTGSLLGKIIDGEEKKRYLLELCAKKGIQSHQVIAVGDGANDIKMMEVAGLSVAWHAKPVVKEIATWQINYGDLSQIAYAFDL